MFSGSPDNCPRVLSPSLRPFDLQTVPNARTPGHLQVRPPLLFHGLTPHPHLPFVPQTGLQCSQCQSYRIPKVAKRQSNEIIDFDSVSSTIATSYLINIRCFYQVTVFFSCFLGAIRCERARTEPPTCCELGPTPACQKK